MSYNGIVYPLLWKGQKKSPILLRIGLFE